MWRIDFAAGSGSAWFGALEDGTIFQHLNDRRWETLMARPMDLDASFELITEVSRQHEGPAVVLKKPVEFAIDEKTADNIRGDVNWNETDMVLMIGFDMALRAGKS